MLDLKRASDHELFVQLAGNADVLIESFSPGTTARLGIDWPTLRERNPRLIYCSITGYGAQTNHAGRPGYDALVAARTGLQWEQRGPDGGAFGHAPTSELPLPEIQTGFADRGGPAREGPLFSSSRWPSLGACHLATTGIAAALYARERTGAGQLVETSLFQGAMASAAFVWQRLDHPEAPGYASWLLDARAPQESFLCSDGRWIHYALPSPRLVLSQRDKDQLSVDENTTGPRQDPDRLQLDIWELAIYWHYYPEMVKIFAQFPSEDWVALGAQVGAPIAPVRSTKEALDDSAYLVDGTVLEVASSDSGTTRQAGFAFSLESYPGLIRGPQPRAGEDTEAVRRESSSFRPNSRPNGDGSGSRHRELQHPLSGIVVVDLGLAVSAPYGTQVLAQLGATVIKVHARYDGAGDSNQMIQATTRGKRSIAIDLKHPAGYEVVCRLVSGADVLQHNMRMGAAERLGLGYPAMARLNPRLVYSHIRGFERGARSERPANDQIVAGISGVQWEDGACANGGKPFWALTPMGDVGAGYLSATAVMLGLIARDRTGLGQNVSTSLLNACLLNNSYVCLDEEGRELRQPELDRDHRGVGALDMLYPTASDWICIEAVLPDHWPRLCRAIGRPDLAIDPRFGTAERREANRYELARLLESVFLTQKAAFWVELLDQHDVPCEQSRQVTLDDLFDDEELASLGWTSSYVHPELGRFDQGGLLVGMSLTPGRNHLRSPAVGEHTRDILAEYGYTNKEISRLVSLGVVGALDERSPRK